jgi:hypothetical protein
MKRINIKNILLSGLLAGSFASCDSFLDEKPNKSSAVEVTTIAQLEALLDTYSTFYQEGNRTAIYSHDDYEFTKAIYDAQPSIYGMAAVEFATWDKEFLPDDTRESFWSGEFRKIFTANLVLMQLDRVNGTAEQKAEIKADAHFIRAYSYFTLAQTYCLPYTEANKKEPGLPLKTTTSFEGDLSRKTLEDLYTFIEADLTEALKTTKTLIQNGRQKHWRANIAAVNGFAARYWLSRNDYTKALTHANVALNHFNTLVDYNTEMRYGRPSNYTIDAGTPQETRVTVQFPYTHDNQTDLTDMIAWKEFMYFRMLYHESWYFIPSQELLALYDQTNDLRYKYHMVQGYSYDRGMIKPSYNYPGYVFFYKDRIPSGPTTAEMLLIKAECLARDNKPADAMSTLNTLRAKRMTPGAWVNLTAADADEAIRLVLEERRREMPFAHRWMDIRRYNNNNYAADDVTISRSFYPYNVGSVLRNEPVQTYPLQKNDRRFAAPIPRTEIITSNGVIEQNTY